MMMTAGNRSEPRDMCVIRKSGTLILIRTLKYISDNDTLSSGDPHLCRTDNIA